MRRKRGQIGLYVIIAIIIVAALVLLLVFKPSVFKLALTAEESQKLVSSQVQPVRDYVEGCMRIVARKTLNTMGRQGGNFFPRAERVNMPASVMSDAPLVSYSLFYDSSRGYLNLLPSLNELKDEFADAIENNIEFALCINDFEPFKKILDVEPSYNLTVDRENLDFGEKSGQIVLPFSYAVKLSKENATTLVDNYVIKIPINMARIRETAARIVNSMAIGKNYMEVISDESKIQWAQLREDASAEKILLDMQAYTEVPTDLAGKDYNEKNFLFKLEYQRPNLEKPFRYYVLIGKPS